MSDSVTVISYRHVVYCLICLAAEKWSVAYILKHTQVGLSALVDLNRFYFILHNNSLKLNRTVELYKQK